MVSAYDWFQLLVNILGIILHSLVGSLFIYKSRKFKIKILLFAGLSIFFLGFMSIGRVSYWLLTISFTGVDISIGIFFTALDTAFLIIYLFCTIYVGVQLLFPKKKWLVFSIFFLVATIQGTVGYIYTIIDPMVYESIIIFILDFSIISVFIFMVIGFLVKSIQYRGKLRIKFIYLLLSYSVVVITQVTQVFLIIISPYNPVSILIGFFSLLYLLFFYYGLKPDKSIKRKKLPSQEEVRLTSYMLGKPIPAEIAEEELKQEISRIQVEKKMTRPILIFMSYATKDAENFKISEISESLTVYDEIENVLYWQEDLYDNIIEYMNDNIKKCDVMILFCSENALNSVPVKKEWTAAEIMGMPIIPVFTNPDHIPPILKSRLGYEIDPDDVQTNVQELYDLALKKCKVYYKFQEHV